MAELSDIRKDLIDDISKWSGATLQRAQRYGAAMATDGMPLSPLYFRPDAPLGSSVADQTLLAAYWQMKTGRPWDGDAMVEAFKTVDLKTIQDQATTMVKAAIPIVHPKPLAQ